MQSTYFSYKTALMKLNFTWHVKMDSIMTTWLSCVGIVQSACKSMHRMCMHNVKKSRFLTYFFFDRFCVEKKKKLFFFFFALSSSEQVPSWLLYAAKCILRLYLCYKMVKNITHLKVSVNNHHYCFKYCVIINIHLKHINFLDHSKYI